LYGRTDRCESTVPLFCSQRVKRSVDGMVVGRDAGADTKSKSAETPDGDVTHGHQRQPIDGSPVASFCMSSRSAYVDRQGVPRRDICRNSLSSNAVDMVHRASSCIAPRRIHEAKVMHIHQECSQRTTITNQVHTTLPRSAAVIQFLFNFTSTRLIPEPSIP
jgi:hypothetical protein